MNRDMEKQHDVCLLLEGTYPFVSGGVSTWLHNLISGMPEIRFTAICIVPSSKEELQIKYDIPDNFTDYKVMYLHDVPDISQFPPKTVGHKQMEMTRIFHNQILNDDYSNLEPVIDAFRNGQMPLEALLHGRKAWDFILKSYGPEKNTESFLNFFWTYRLTHLAIFQAVQFDIPKARVYHSISTGYAGLLGAVAKILYNRPFLLTEHGIYVKERKIEISQADWIQQEEQNMRVARGLSFFQDYWVRIFTGLARIAYNKADRIYTLYEGNKQLEIAEGAPEDRIEIIPNGIDIEEFQAIPKRDLNEGATNGYAIGFVGRVVPIKDVKTFIRACKIVSMKLDITAYIMGPTEEDEDYFHECEELVELLNLQNNIHFLGKVNVLDYYSKVDLIVLTSISEAQPLVIMEANCAGVPAVATDVGSCSELLGGRTEQDIALGPSGLVTKTADPIDTANAIQSILTDKELRSAMREAGQKRIATYYQESELINRYLNIYNEYMEQG